MPNIRAHAQALLASLPDRSALPARDRSEAERLTIIIDAHATTYAPPAARLTGEEDPLVEVADRDFRPAVAAFVRSERDDAPNAEHPRILLARALMTFADAAVERDDLRESVALAFHAYADRLDAENAQPADAQLLTILLAIIDRAN